MAPCKWKVCIDSEGEIQCGPSTYCYRLWGLYLSEPIAVIPFGGKVRVL